MEDQDISVPAIKVEVKQEYDENIFSDAGYSYDASKKPYYGDEDIEIKEEPCNFNEDCKDAVKIEIKEEIPNNGSGKNEFWSLSAPQDPVKCPQVERIRVKSFASQVKSMRHEYHRLKITYLQEEHELKTKVLEAKNAYYLALQENEFDCKPS